MLLVEKKAALTGHKDAVYCLLQTGNELEFFSAGGDGLIVKWNLAEGLNGNVVARLPQAVYSLCLLQDENLLVAGTRFGKLFVLDLEKKAEVKTLELKGDIFGLQHLAENKISAICAGGHFYIIDAKHFMVELYMQPTQQNGRVLALNNNGKLLATGWSDGFIRIYETGNFSLVNEFFAHDKSVFALLFTDENKLISGGRDAQLKIWNAGNNFEIEKTIPAHLFTVNKLIYSPSKKYFASASRDKTAKIWNAENFELLKVIDRPKLAAHTHSVNALLWPVENTLITGGDDKNINIWQLNFDAVLNS